MKYLVSLLMVLSALFVEAQTYEKIKVAVPSEKYKSIEASFIEHFDGLHLSSTSRPVGLLLLEACAKDYYDFTMEHLPHLLNNVTPAKVNKVVGDFITSDYFELSYSSVLVGSESEIPLKDRVGKFITIMDLTLRGTKGIYVLFLEEVCKRAAIKSLGISL